jgi:hypothetical protein
VTIGIAPIGTPPSVEITYKVPKLPPAPTVTRLSPNKGPPSGGTVVKIFGTNLSTPLAVHFGKGAAKIDKVVSAREIEVTSPKGTGMVAVRVRTARGTSPDTKADRFSY